MRNVSSKIIDKMQKPRSVTLRSTQVVHHIMDQVYLRPWTQVHQQLSMQMKANLKFKV
jgi:hypothetical protein